VTADTASEAPPESMVDTPTDVGPTRTEVMVSTTDLRNALRSVVVHAGKDDEVPTLTRVRLYIRQGNIMVAATQRYTVGIGLVSIWTDTAYDNAVLDLTAVQIAELLAMFKSPKEKKHDAGDDDLRLRITDRFLTVTDVAGLVPGKEVTWPRVANDQSFPDLLKLIGQLRAKAGTASAATIHTSGAMMALFRTASAVYDQPVTMEPTGEHTVMLISIGESFIGAIMPIKPSLEFLTEMAEHQRAWDARLGQVDVETGELEPIVPAPAADPEPEEDGTEVPGQTAIDDEDADELVARAAALAIGTQFSSASMLQRKMRVGAALADQIMNQLEQFGVVGPKPGGTRPRAVLIGDMWADGVASVIRDGGSPADVARAIGRVPAPDPADEDRIPLDDGDGEVPASV
jgi:hypothetical protein